MILKFFTRSRGRTMNESIPRFGQRFAKAMVLRQRWNTPAKNVPAYVIFHRPVEPTAESQHASETLH